MIALATAHHVAAIGRGRKDRGCPTVGLCTAALLFTSQAVIVSERGIAASFTRRRWNKKLRWATEAVVVQSLDKHLLLLLLTIAVAAAAVAAQRCRRRRLWRITAAVQLVGGQQNRISAGCINEVGCTCCTCKRNIPLRSAATVVHRHSTPNPPYAFLTLRACRCCRCKAAIQTGSPPPIVRVMVVLVPAVGRRSHVAEHLATRAWR